MTKSKTTRQRTTAFGTHTAADKTFCRLCADVVLARSVDSDEARELEQRAFAHLADYVAAVAFASSMATWDDDVTGNEQ